MNVCTCTEGISTCSVDAHRWQCRDYFVILYWRRCCFGSVLSSPEYFVVVVKCLYWLRISFLPVVMELVPAVGLSPHLQWLRLLSYCVDVPSCYFKGFLSSYFFFCWKHERGWMESDPSAGYESLSIFISFFPSSTSELWLCCLLSVYWLQLLCLFLFLVIYSLRFLSLMFALLSSFVYLPVVLLLCLYFISLLFGLSLPVKFVFLLSSLPSDSYSDNMRVYFITPFSFGHNMSSLKFASSNFHAGTEAGLKYFFICRFTKIKSISDRCTLPSSHPLDKIQPCLFLVRPLGVFFPSLQQNYLL